MLQPDLDRVATLQFVRGRMGNPRNPLLSTHAESVAAKVADIAPRYYRATRGSFLVPAVVELIAAMDHAALMHDMISNFGCTFESLAGVTNMQVADLVARQSPDYRLPEPQRYLHRRGELSQADISAKIVALADIACHAHEFLTSDLESLTNEETEQIVRDSTAWYEDLDSFRFERQGLLREQKDQAQQMLHTVLTSIAANMKARGLRSVIAENIRQRQAVNGKEGTNGHGSHDLPSGHVQARPRRRSRAG